MIYRFYPDIVKPLDKLDEKYLKNVKFIKDDDDRTREVGEINFLTIPAEKLIEVLKHVEELKLEHKLEHNYHKKSAKWSDNDYMEEYRYALIKCFNMYEKDLLDLIKKFIYVAKDTGKYESFAKILNVTCKLSYMDYNNFQFEYFHPSDETGLLHPSQKNIDHNYVGSYQLLINKPIPLGIIQAMKDEVKKFKITKIKKDTEEFDKNF